MLLIAFYDANNPDSDNNLITVERDQPVPMIGTGVRLRMVGETVEGLVEDVVYTYEVGKRTLVSVMLRIQKDVSHGG